MQKAAICQSPSPQARPIAPAIHMPAPVVRPCTSPRVKITSAGGQEGDAGGDRLDDAQRIEI